MHGVVLNYSSIGTTLPFLLHDVEVKKHEAAIY
jgi:hypothetical protein